MPDLPLHDDRRASLTAPKATEDDTWFRRTTSSFLAITRHMKQKQPTQHIRFGEKKMLMKKRLKITLADRKMQSANTWNVSHGRAWS